MKAKKTTQKISIKTVLFFGFIITGFIILCALGTWQVFRLEEKQKLIAQIEEGFGRAPVPFSSMKEGEDLSYRRFIVKGKFIPHSEFFLLNRKSGEEWGKDILGLFQNGENPILIDLDWMDKDENGSLSGSRQEFIGYFAAFPKNHIFRPEHTEGHNTLLWIDRDFIEKETGHKLFDWVFTVTENRNPDYKTRNGLYIDIPNNHRQYAFFWYTMAGVLLGMGYLVWRSRDKK